jgi:hypothetical protein
MRRPRGTHKNKCDAQTDEMAEFKGDHKHRRRIYSCGSPKPPLRLGNEIGGRVI